MTIVTTVRCDGFGCPNETEVESGFESDVTAEGYRVDPNDGFTHYCSRCWPEVQREIDEEEQQ